MNKPIGHDRIGPNHCSDCRESMRQNPQHGGWCSRCDSVRSKYFTHFGAAETFLVTIGFADIAHLGIQRFLHERSDDSASGVSWDKSIARQLLAAVEIPSELDDEVILHAVATYYRLKQWWGFST